MALAGTDIALTVNPGWARARSPFSTNAIPRGERAGCAAASVWGRIPQAPLMSWLEKNPVHETDDIRPAAGEHGKPSGHFVARPECAPVCGPALVRWPARNALCSEKEKAHENRAGSDNNRSFPGDHGRHDYGKRSCDIYMVNVEGA